MGPRGVPTYPLGFAERWHRNLPSLAKERNPGISLTLARCARCRLLGAGQPAYFGGVTVGAAVRKLAYFSLAKLAQKLAQL
jgi:hypothetical protein